MKRYATHHPYYQSKMSKTPQKIAPAAGFFIVSISFLNVLEDSFFPYSIFFNWLHYVLVNVIYQIITQLLKEKSDADQQSLPTLCAEMRPDFTIGRATNYMNPLVQCQESVCLTRGTCFWKLNEKLHYEQTHPENSDTIGVFNTNALKKLLKRSTGKGENEAEDEVTKHKMPC